MSLRLLTSYAATANSLTKFPARIQRAFQCVQRRCAAADENSTGVPMKIKNSLKALKARHRDNQLVRRKGRVYIINKTAPRFKARQG